MKILNNKKKFIFNDAINIRFASLRIKKYLHCMRNQTIKLLKSYLHVQRKDGCIGEGRVFHRKCNVLGQHVRDKQGCSTACTGQWLVQFECMGQARMQYSMYWTV